MFVQIISGLMQLPDEARILILQLVTVGVLWLLLKLSQITGKDFSGYAPAMAAVIAPIIITLLESALGTIDPIFDNLVLSIIHVIVLLLGSVGGLLLFRRRVSAVK